MRTLNTALMLVALSTIGLAPLSSAQMMGGMQGQMPMGQNDSLSHSATMGTGQMNTMTPADSVVGQISQADQKISNDFAALQAHLEKMMEIQDLKALRVEMQKQSQMLKATQSDLNVQESMYQNMLSMMHSDRMHSMMYPDSTQAGYAGQRGHTN